MYQPLQTRRTVAVSAAAMFVVLVAIAVTWPLLTGLVQDAWAMLTGATLSFR